MSAIKADVQDVFSGKKTVSDIDYLSPELGRSIERMQLISARGTDDIVKCFRRRDSYCSTKQSPRSKIPRSIRYN